MAKRRGSSLEGQGRQKEYITLLTAKAKCDWTKDIEGVSGREKPFPPEPPLRCPGTPGCHTAG